MRKFFGIMLALIITAGGLLGVVAPNQVSATESGAKHYSATVYNEEEGGNYLGLATETIYYHHKVNEQYTLNPDLPGYGSSLGCGNIAGGNIVSWYNRLYPELIPGHTAGITFMGAWLWASTNEYTAAAFGQLYIDMNGVNGGVTINGYLNGMNKYTTGKGRTFTRTNVMGTGGEMLNSDYKAAIKNGELMTIFIDGFNIMSTVGVTGYTSQGYDIVEMEVYTGAHVMAVYGYREISYYNSQNQLIRKDIYLIVHTGFGGLMGMTKITSYCTLDDAYITHIS